VVLFAGRVSACIFVSPLLGAAVPGPLVESAGRISGFAALVVVDAAQLVLLTTHSRGSFSVPTGTFLSDVRAGHSVACSSVTAQQTAQVVVELHSGAGQRPKPPGRVSLEGQLDSRRGRPPAVNVRAVMSVRQHAVTPPGG
jgi:hypothetical protein